ncbi:hypothetical protein GCM10009069_05030 [Algimonas arctica]|uniref:Uncharacterized protein n=1 Tax=Algimonas arctica TaxID=1479486 RepID=A0A8J3G192_9PROT|nr:hypothetical protein GCM10009069_05030 [Algimonas arctica]
MIIFAAGQWTGPNMSIPEVGVNTQADSTNRLAVKLDTVLFSHGNVTPGTGDMRVVINRNDTTRSGAFMWQTNYQAQAEWGLEGPDDLTLKVTDDGASSQSAMRVFCVTVAVHCAAGLTAQGALVCPSGSDYSNLSMGFSHGSGSPGAGEPRQLRIRRNGVESLAHRLE